MVLFFPRLIYLPVQFFIRDAEINLNFKITCNLGQLWVSGGSLAVCVQYWHSLCFVQELTSNLMGFFVYKRCLELEMQKSAHGMVLETSSKSHFEFVAVLGLQDELMNLPVKSGLARSTQPREEKMFAQTSAKRKLMTFTRS